jgi:methionine synthase II (cobalamin-independent)
VKLTGLVTGIGSVPEMPTGTAARWTLDQFPALAHVAEIPARGPWSAMVGRAGALLSGLSMELTAHGWRLVPAAGADQRRIDAHFRGDIDALEEARGEGQISIKTQVVGPWTLASNLETTTARKVLQDKGACRDIAQSLADGVTEHVQQLRKSGFTDVVVQIDEPSITGIRNGAGGSLFSQPRVPPDEEIRAIWQILRERLDCPLVIHSCAPSFPWHLAHDFDAISIDAATNQDQDGMGAWLDSGKALWWGAVPVSAAPLPELSTSVASVRTALGRLGFDDRVSERLAITAACGFASLARSDAERLIRRLNDINTSLIEEG